MSGSLTSFPGRDFHDLGDEQAKRLLKLGITKSFRPIDALIQRLEADDGPAWLKRVLDGPPFVTAIGSADDLASGRASLNQMIALKESGKAQARDPDRGARLVARAAYDLAILAALAHHGQTITTQKAGELADGLTDLAEALPEPWTGLARRAIERLAASKK